MRRFVKYKIEDLNDQLKEWKEILKSVSDDRTEKHVQKRVDEFLDSQNMKKLTYVILIFKILPFQNELF